MSYKAFVTSTFKDLKGHRAQAIRELRNAGFEVDPMEDWTASADEPKEFSTERLEGCHLCVLLVGRRRGHVPEGESLSITQMEVQEAQRRGIDVLPFMLDDGVDEKQWPWEEKEIVRAWRAELLEHFGVGTFKKTPTTLRIGAALNRWVQEQGPQVALRLYLESVKQHHGYIKFLGLPRLEDIQDAPIQRLFVEPAVADRAVSPDIDPEEWPATTPIREALAGHRRLVLLGDPGSGKSTLVDWLAWQLAEGNDIVRGGSPDRTETADRRSPGTTTKGRGDLRSPAVARSGDRPQQSGDRPQQSLIPLPMVLRELGIGPGITWEKLLQAFVDRPLGKLLTLANLERILADGRAMIMLDGLDEIGNPHVRQELRTAIWNGIGQHYDCRWLLTSRIVGYDEVPYDEDRLKIPDLALSKVRRIKPLPAKLGYVTPFDDRRVDEFARNWFVLREKTTYKAKQGADDLLKAIRSDESTMKLGRIPILLTMMALIYRIRARLPHGRALLYNEIAQAYLETIDFFRQIATRSEPLADKKRWLARVGFEMQRQRSVAAASSRSSVRHLGQDAPATTEILAAGDDVRAWIAAAMGQSQEQHSDEDAAEFVDYLGRRTGLLLPRGQDRFAFMHLSFQEYFAACFLAKEIASFKWASERPGIPDGANKSDLKQHANQTVWRETLIFLIELLAASDQTDWLTPTLECLFGEAFADVRDGGEAAGGQSALLARLAVDPHAGFAETDREQAIRACCAWEIREQKRLEDTSWIHDMDVLRALLATESKPQRQSILAELAAEAQRVDLKQLRLDGTPASDLAPLAGLAALRVLDLRGTPVSDLAPLAGLAALRWLDLEGTPVSDLAPLAGLAALHSLYLQGTQVSDLAPLAGLKNVTIYLDKSQEVKIPKELEGRVHRR